MVARVLPLLFQVQLLHMLVVVEVVSMEAYLA
jgi:hypothetical protein